MKVRIYLLFMFFAFLFLFYPGDAHYYDVFAFNRDAFQKTQQKTEKTTHIIPYVKSTVEPALSGQGVYIVDLPSFTPVYEKNIHERFFPASTTKMITALVAYDIYKPNKVIQIKKPLTDGHIMGLIEGERITVENLLYGILVHSGNDAAYALADEIGFDTFIAKMNEKAESLHMTQSLFKNPAGLDNMDQYSTPFDLALAAREILKNEYLAKIASTKEITISDVDYRYFHQLTNVNRLLGEIPGIGGLKTGYTENAGENLISYYRKNGHEFIIVILKSDDRFLDTKTAVDWIDQTVDYTIYSAT